MTVSDPCERLAASLKRAYVDHRIEQKPDGDVLLTLGPAQRLVVETLYGQEGFPALDRQNRGVEVEVTLTGSEAEDLAARVESAYAR